MQNARPLVSVVVPAYNAAAFLGETLKSVSAQSYGNLEIIVVDDGSTDSTAAVVAEHAQRDPRIRLIRQPNAGVGAARNAGITAAVGEYLAPLDADDVWDPEKIQAQVEAMERSGEEAGFAYCWVRTIDETGQVTGVQPSCSVEGRVFNALFFRNFLHCASVPLFRTVALKRVGGYATREAQGGVQGCEDWELCLRVAEKYAACVVPRILVSYRILVVGGMSFNVAGMERSFLWMVEETRKRMPAVPPKLIRWSAAHFYLYLALKAKRSYQIDWALRCLGAAARRDLAVFLAPRFYAILAMSCYRRWRPRKPAPVQAPTGQAPAPAVIVGVPRWRLRQLVDAEVFWGLYLQIERRRFADLVGLRSP